MTAYNPKQIEAKWQAHWEREKPFRAIQGSDKPKFYGLIEFPYPSGVGLHVGHPRPYTAMDILCRQKRMAGYNVLMPMGWDAFGLPSENYAILHNIHPSEVTRQNINTFRQQLKRLGLSVDWDREVNTSDPAYYRWTQWIFLQLFKKGLAYKAEIPINFCTSCKIGLANEEVVGGVCERCGGAVERRAKAQWMLRITDYAEKLLEGLETVDYIDSVRAQQRNWIGRSEGAEVVFRVSGSGQELRVFTTRADTLFGATYMVLSPEHPLIDELKGSISNFDEVAEYRVAASRKSDFERAEMSKEKTGVALKGVACVNPATGNDIPVWISDYVLMSYGTGAIMAVPGHDGRDWEFARKFGLPVIEVVAGGDIEKEAYTDIEQGTMVNSGFLNGLSVQDAKKAMVDWLNERGLGQTAINYRLRDWVFSRQRYWGEPIPLVNCPKCGWVPLPEESLPLLLPDTKEFKPGKDGESALAALTDWVHTTCPECGGEALRETDTMPNWAGSSWYFLRYLDPNCDTAIASREAIDYWMPVDWYNGGMEHTTLHLLYSRFWHRFLYDIGVVSTPEPYAKRTSHGLILAEDGGKMSKSRPGSVISIDSAIDDVGCDAFRLYEMFIGAFDQPIAWSVNGSRGCRRFIERVWRLMEMTRPGKVRPEISAVLNQTIKKVTEDLERIKFNTAVAQMMTLLNAVYETGHITSDELRVFLLLLSPFAPHVCEEMWQLMGFKGYTYDQKWPEYDEAALTGDEVEIAVQIMGKVKARIKVSAQLSADEAQAFICAIPEVAALLEGKTIKKFIYVPGRNCNIVVG